MGYSGCYFGLFVLCDSGSALAGHFKILSAPAHAGLILVFGIAYLGVFGWTVALREQMTVEQGLAPAVAALLLWFLQKRGRLSPLLAGPRSLLGLCLPLLRGGLLLGLAVPGAVRPMGLEALLGMICLSLVSTEGARRFWRSLGLLSLPGPWAFFVWLGASAGWWYARSDLLGALLLLLVLRRSARLAVDQELTPSRATVMMKLPMIAMNALLELVPAATLRLWFRPDPFRLHLREPLMEAQKRARLPGRAGRSLERTLWRAHRDRRPAGQFLRQLPGKRRSWRLEHGGCGADQARPRIPGQ